MWRTMYRTKNHGSYTFLSMRWIWWNEARLHQILGIKFKPAKFRGFFTIWVEL